MACKADSECPRGQVCVDDACVPISDTPEEEKFSFAKAASRYMRDVKAEERKVDIYSRFLQGEIEEAVKEREEAYEDIGWWGKLGQVFGGGLGCAIGFSLGGPGGCIAGASVGSGLGSGGARWVADAFDNVESYGISDDELNRLSDDDLKFLKTEFWDIRDEYDTMQTDLENYDETEWKKHVANTLGDVWQTFQVASTAVNLGSMIAGAGKETAKQVGGQGIIETTSSGATKGGLMVDGSWYGSADKRLFDPKTILDN